MVALTFDNVFQARVGDNPSLLSLPKVASTYIHDAFSVPGELGFFLHPVLINIKEEINKTNIDNIFFTKPHNDVFFQRKCDMGFNRLTGTVLISEFRITFSKQQIKSRSQNESMAFPRDRSFPNL